MTPLKVKGVRYAVERPREANSTGYLRITHYQTKVVMRVHSELVLGRQGR